jgi:hypothetical protein
MLLTRSHTRSRLLVVLHGCLHVHGKASQNRELHVRACQHIAAKYLDPKACHWQSMSLACRWHVAGMSI